ERISQEQQEQLTQLGHEISSGESAVAVANSQHVEAEKSLVAATHLLDQARSDLQRIELQLSTEREEISRLNSEAEAARLRVEQSRRQHAEAVRSRAATETESSDSAEKLLRM